MHRGSAVDRINARFRLGQPSDNVEAAGVLLHQFDDMEDTNAPWMPCPQFKWCGEFGDRFSASMINARLPPGGPPGLIGIFSNTVAGFIFAPEAAEVFCAYAADGGTMAKKCHPPGPSPTCIPGCMRKTGGLRDALQTHEARLEQNAYNEIVVDTRPMAEDPSRSIEAIFYLDNDQCGRDKRCEANAKDAHRLLIEKYGGDQPLLVLDLANWETPFRQVS